MKKHVGEHLVEQKPGPADGLALLNIDLYFHVPEHGEAIVYPRGRRGPGYVVPAHRLADTRQRMLQLVLVKPLLWAIGAFLAAELVVLLGFASPIAWAVIAVYIALAVTVSAYLRRRVTAGLSRHFAPPPAIDASLLRARARQRIGPRWTEYTRYGGPFGLLAYSLVLIIERIRGSAPPPRADAPPSKGDRP